MTSRRILRLLGIWPFTWITGPLMWALARRFGREPVPLRTLLRIRRFGAGPDPLAREGRVVSAGALRDRDLSALLAGRNLGGWALGADSIEELERLFRYLQPGLVVEFGSGVSTLCLAYYASTTSHGPVRAKRVIAIEQDIDHARNISEALDVAGLSGIAAVVHAPLVMKRLDGQDYSAYELPVEFLSPSSGVSPDLVLVDGPAAETGARYATLHGLRPLLRRGTAILLDDALRDGELEAADRWERQGWMTELGVRLIDKGLLTGYWTS